MVNSKPILVVTDLTERSDPAVHFAGRVAQLHGAELHVIYAMDLMRRPLRAVLPALDNARGTVREAEECIRAQIRRLVADDVVTPAPIIDVDDPARTVRRRAQQLEPQLIVTPAMWEWNPVDRLHRNGFRAAFAHAPAPVLIVREIRRAIFGRVTLLSHSETFHAHAVETGGRWDFWLGQLYGQDCATRGTEFNVMLLDDEVPVKHARAKLVDPRVDLIVIDADLLQQPAMNEELDALMPTILKQTLTPIALLTHNSPGGGNRATFDFRSSADPQPRDRAVEQHGMAAD